MDKINGTQSKMLGAYLAELARELNLAESLRVVGYIEGILARQDVTAATTQAQAQQKEA